MKTMVCQVLMLSTNQKALPGQIVDRGSKIGGDQLFIMTEDNFRSWENNVVNPHKGSHLYFVSTIEPKVGDWVYVNCSEVEVQEIRQITGYYNEQFLFDDKSQIHIDYCKKIEATTDTSIAIKKDILSINQGRFINHYPTEKRVLPQISESFIQAYIKAYNEGNPITEVNLEMVLVHDLRTGDKSKEFSERIKTRKDNTVIIHPAKMYSRSEVIHLIEQFNLEMPNEYQTLESWIKENLI
jgi:hypothetical protein